MSFPIDTQNYQRLIGTHNLYKVRALNLEIIIDTDYGCDCFDLPISKVLQDQQSIGTHNLYKVRALNLETIMNTNCGCDCFDIPISEVFKDQHLGILGMSYT